MRMDEFGSQIREYRKKAGLTQRQLAVELGMSNVTISRIEDGSVSEIGIRKFSRMCRRIGLEIQLMPSKGIPQLADALAANKAKHISDLHETSAILAGITVAKRKKRHA